MVRLEKIVYEQVVNSKTLGRARAIVTPAKWYVVNPHEQNKCNQEIMQLLPMSFSEGLFWEDSYSLSIRLGSTFKGISNEEISSNKTFEDQYLHTDVQLRRNVLWEHIARENLHPYHWLLKIRRRARYWKIERGLRGFFVPEFIRSQAKSQTYNDYVEVDNEWKNFVYNNYMSDMTPTARRTALPNYGFDWVMNYGLWNNDAWERYFFNERDQGDITQKQAKFVRDPKRFPYDLTTAEGKREFEQNIEKVNQKYPGIVAVEGQKFDFKQHYAKLGV